MNTAIEKTVVILVHGYNVTNPERTVGKFRGPMEETGAVVEGFTYGFVPFTWQITRRNPMLAKKLGDRVKHWLDKGFSVNLVAHSNGATICYLAGRHHGATFDKVMYIHPALRKDANPCESANKIYVIHNDGDKAVMAGRFLGRIVGFFSRKPKRARPWGKMGKDGYQGKFDKRVVNIDTDNGEKFSPTAWGHSDEFKNGKAAYFMPRLTRLFFEG